MDLKKKTIVVTGAGQGIGRSIALTQAAAGANLALLDVNAETLRISCELCAAHGVDARPYVTNVADEEGVTEVFAQIAADLGSIDGLVNNAGIVRDGLLLKVKNGELQSRMSIEQWQMVMNVNLTGVFLCGREAATHMVRQGTGGVIVNMSSVARAGNIGQTNYSATKAGVSAMTVVWARELGQYGIRVGSVAPGYTRTDILSGMKPEVLEKVLLPVPLKRLGEADEIAHAVRFIFENDFFTGRCIELDGGLRL